MERCAVDGDLFETQLLNDAPSLLTPADRYRGASRNPHGSERPRSSCRYVVNL